MQIFSFKTLPSSLHLVFPKARTWAQGPSLFSLYIHDIYDGLKCDDFLFFADDIKLFREVSCVPDQLDQHNDLNCIAD